MGNNANRIGSITMVAMVAMALGFDAIEIGLEALFAIGSVLNPAIITPTKWFMFWLWFKFHGINLADFTGKSGQKKVLVAVITLITGLIPILADLPEFTLGIVATLVMTRMEDKAKRSVVQSSEQNQKEPRTLRRSASDRGQENAGDESGRLFSREKRGLISNNRRENLSREEVVVT